MANSRGCPSCCRPRLNDDNGTCEEHFCDQPCVENGTVEVSGVDWTEVYTIPEMLLGYFGTLLDSDNNTLEDVELFFDGGTVWQSDTLIAPSPCLAVLLEYDYAGEITAQLDITMNVGGLGDGDITLTFTYQVFIGESDAAIYEWEFQNTRDVQDGLCSFQIEEANFTDDANYPIATYGTGWCIEDKPCMCVCPRRDGETVQRCDIDEINQRVGSVVILDAMTVSVDSTTSTCGNFSEEQDNAAADFNHTQLIGSIDCGVLTTPVFGAPANSCCWYVCYSNPNTTTDDCSKPSSVLVPTIAAQINNRWQAYVFIEKLTDTSFRVTCYIFYEPTLCWGPIQVIYQKTVSDTDLDSGTVDLDYVSSIETFSSWTFPATVTITF